MCFTKPSSGTTAGSTPPPSRSGWKAVSFRMEIVSAMLYEGRGDDGVDGDDNGDGDNGDGNGDSNGRALGRGKGREERDEHGQGSRGGGGD